MAAALPPQLGGSQDHHTIMDEKLSEQAQTSACVLPNESTNCSSSSSLPKIEATDLSPSAGPLKIPFPYPLQSSQPLPVPNLTPEQLMKYNTLLAAASSWTTVPTAASPKSTHTPITEPERQWLTRECLLRYLRATKWSVPDASTRLLSTLGWRREYGVSEHTADYISPEAETGKQLLLGYDIHARPCLYLIPARQNTKMSPRQVQHLVYMLERTIEIMPPGQETLSLLVNLADSGSKNGVQAGVGRQVLGILQSHYPERLGRALIINVPWLVWGFFKLITPFIDPYTREKMIFNEDMRKHVPPAQLLNTYDGKKAGQNGEVDFQYDHSVYWPRMNKLAQERRTAQHDRWVEGGKRVGEYEAYLRGGEQKCLKVVEGQNSAVGGVDDSLRPA